MINLSSFLHQHPLHLAGEGLLLIIATILIVLFIDGLGPKASSGRTCLYIGRVWHARFKPTFHKFGYGFFYTYLDLDHLEGSFKGMWPLASCTRPAFARFEEKDHLKDIQREDEIGLPLVERIRRLVTRETGVRPKGAVCLLTHLSYMGYCFNPVSFYYVWDEKGQEIETVVAEVSNTPWNEMHCYVLNPRNKTTIKEAKIIEKEDGPVWNYVFQKAFHVSPFMDMDHIYDWEFNRPVEKIWVITHMLRQGTERYFTARFDLYHHAFRPWSFFLCVLRFPLITWAVQFLIHLQAFRLWFKKVPFYDHPQGTQTWASNVIGMMMTPLWKVQAWIGGGGSGAAEDKKAA